MIELAASHENVYSKNRLKKKYNNTIFFDEMNSKADVVYFEDTASSIVNDAWFQNRKEKGKDETRRIVRIAAKTIASELQSLTYSTDAYPLDEEISDLNLNKDWLPNHLRIFMETLVKDPLHQVSLGQALAHFMRPRFTIPPILFGLLVELDHVFGSKWVFNELDPLGLSMNYSEVILFKDSVLVNDDSKKFLKEVATSAFRLWSADNVDHNICSHSGLGSLHGMGMVISTAVVILRRRNPYHQRLSKTDR